MYDEQPLWNHIIAGEGKIEKDSESKTCIADPTGEIAIEPIISSLWLSMGMTQSPRHKELFEKAIA
jgi:hypothetical protein